MALIGRGQLCRLRRDWRVSSLAVAVFGLAAAFLSFQANAAESGTSGLQIELNKLEPVGEACRVYMVFQNETAQNLEELRLDLVLFGKDGVISKRLSVNAAPLDAGRKVVKTFDLAGIDCGGVGEVLLNDVTTCPRDAEAAAGCVAPAIATRSATGAVPFIH